MAEQTLNENMINMKKEQIVLLSSELFLKQGIEEVKMTDVAELCQIGVASLYRYFGTKTKLTIEVGTLLWKDLGILLQDSFDSPEFQKKTGINQLKQLLFIYLKLYREHPHFLKFLGDFDLLMIVEKVPPEELKEYEASIFDFYSVGKAAYEKGVEDGTVRDNLDFLTLYQSFSLSMMSLSQKFIRGNILPGDSYMDAEQQLIQMADLAIYYLSNG